MLEVVLEKITDAKAEDFLDMVRPTYDCHVIWKQVTFCDRHVSGTSTLNLCFKKNVWYQDVHYVSYSLKSMKGLQDCCII